MPLHQVFGAFHEMWPGKVSVLSLILMARQDPVIFSTVLYTAKQI